ncbi:DUF4132 domain-containing protein [Actinomadura darangshiensis]|uniref:DUF4132 domain-containing protein n=2 Tax=Actinomadura darangshiensis TaxID=705336 RepID=A0A4R5BLN6_9ACTN|nr:DUF4132 domain-containing protein [Actinomadura darangshiensis]
MERYPVRAIRVLAAASEENAGDLLTDHLRANSDSLPHVLPGLPGESRATVERLIKAGDRVAEASPDELPRLLVDPPWTRTVQKAKPVVLKGLIMPADQAVVWKAGERDTWLSSDIFYPYPDSWHLGRNERGYGDVGVIPAPQERAERWDRWIARFQAGRVNEDQEWMAGLLAMGPEELVRPALREWVPGEWKHPGGWWSPENWLKVLIARFGLDALPVTLRFARAKPSRGAALLMSFLDGEVAVAMADWLLRTRSMRDVATAWFDRHGPAALPYLVPVAAGKAGKARTAAEYALLFLARREGEEAVLAAARAHGDQAVELVETLLTGDPENLLPRRKIPGDLGVQAETLPQVLLNGRERALPVSSVRHLLTLLAISTPEDPDPGLAGVLAACDDHSLAEFGRALRGHWVEYGADAATAWQFSALGWLGDDEVVHELVPLIREWPGVGLHHHAVRGLDVLAVIGTDLALREIHAISQKVKYKGLKKRAQEKVEQIAAARGLTGEQLGDRLVPDFGLDADGALVLDYGPRRFTAGFDEALKPYVIDENGKFRSTLPKPGVRDDAELAPAAHQRFGRLKKDVRAIAGIQLQRLERAMTTQRRWSLAEFNAFFVRHPLVWHIARRLVWLSEHGDTATAFRLAEDRTFADVDDDVLTPSEDATITIAHPLHLAETLKRWSQVLADYEIQQPFPQLGRDVHTLTDAERDDAELKRFHDRTVPTGKVIGMERRGWQRGTPEDNGIQFWILRPVPGGRAIVVGLDPGIPIGTLDLWPEQRIERVWLNDGTGLTWHSDRGSPLTFSELDPVTASEIINDLTVLTT